jgi:hypothetical protein
MQNSYFEAVEQLVDTSTRVVQVLLSDSTGHLEIYPTSRSLPNLQEFINRRLRPIGVLGLQGSRVAFAFKEELPENTICAIGTAYGAYINALLGPDAADQIERAEISELTRLYTLPDDRMN